MFLKGEVMFNSLSVSGCSARCSARCVGVVQGVVAVVWAGVVVLRSAPVAYITCSAGPGPANVYITPALTGRPALTARHRQGPVIHPDPSWARGFPNGQDHFFFFLPFPPPPP